MHSLDKFLLLLLICGYRIQCRQEFPAGVPKKFAASYEPRSTDFSASLYSLICLSERPVLPLEIFLPSFAHFLKKD